VCAQISIATGAGISSLEQPYIGCHTNIYPVCAACSLARRLPCRSDGDEMPRQNACPALPQVLIALLDCIMTKPEFYLDKMADSIRDQYERVSTCILTDMFVCLFV
jgi:hypothetical protein